MADEGFLITDLTGDRRKYVAMLGLRARFKMAKNFGRTDGVALAAARGWMAKVNYKGGQKTMNQCLRWVESEIERLQPIVTENK